jgi:hypothetical protein
VKLPSWVTRSVVWSSKTVIEVSTLGVIRSLFAVKSLFGVKDFHASHIGTSAPALSYLYPI